MNVIRLICFVIFTGLWLIAISAQTSHDTSRITRFERVIAAGGKIYEIERTESNVQLLVTEGEPEASVALKLSRIIPARTFGDGPVRFDVTTERLFCILPANNVPELRSVLLSDIVEANRTDGRKNFREVWIDSKGVTHLPPVFLTPLGTAGMIARARGEPTPYFDVVAISDQEIQLYILDKSKLRISRGLISSWKEAPGRTVEWTDSLVLPVQSSGPFHVVHQGRSVYIIFETGKAYVVDNGTLRELGNLTLPPVANTVLLVDRDNETIAFASTNESKADLATIPRTVIRNARIEQTALSANVSAVVSRRNKAR